MTELEVKNMEPYVNCGCGLEITGFRDESLVSAMFAAHECGEPVEQKPRRWFEVIFSTGNLLVVGGVISLLAYFYLIGYSSN